MLALKIRQMRIVAHGMNDQCVALVLYLLP